MLFAFPYGIQTVNKRIGGGKKYAWEGGEQEVCSFPWDWGRLRSMAAAFRNAARKKRGRGGRARPPQRAGLKPSLVQPHRYVDGQTLAHAYEVKEKSSLMTKTRPLVP